MINSPSSLNFPNSPISPHQHLNPYDEKLNQFQSLVFRDHKAEEFKGSWKNQVFENKNPLHLEIGPGNGDFMVDFCQMNPSINLVGIDYCYKRGLKIAKKLSNLKDQTGQQNFKYLRAWAQRLDHLFDEAEIDCLYYFFPDPWPKLRHHKKRLFNVSYLKMLSQKLSREGSIMIKTDHEGYFDWMLETVKNHNLKENKIFEIELQTRNLHVDFPQHFLAQFKTQFEKIFIEQNTPIKALVLKLAAHRQNLQ
jgi:tRNA (guanine-N7-)-methyltransferase